jgi:serine/threonine protein kinase
MALKVFDRDVCTEAEWNARLERGTQVWSTLTHPQVGMVRHAGWWDGTPFGSMEYAPQKCLAEALTNRQYSIRAALEWIEQLLVVICYLHRRGVVHGNLKPSNVLMAADGIPRVIDFRALSGLSFGELPTTYDSSTRFTCLAPEVLADPTCDVGPWADIDGVGAILYELLTGRPLFVASSAADLYKQIQSSTPEPLSTFHRDVSPELDAFCQRCLNKSLWSRYARAYDVLIRVREFLATFNGSTLARPKRN